MDRIDVAILAGEMGMIFASICDVYCFTTAANLRSQHKLAFNMLIVWHLFHCEA